MLALTREEALDFVDRRLGIKDTEKLFVENRFGLLNDLIVAFHNNIPFQTMRNLVVKSDSQRIPSVDEIKKELFAGIGGCCISLNGFFQALLSVLGYDCYLTAGYMWGSATAKISHATTIVQNLLQANDNYLVEVGLASPTFAAISLDFQKESPTVPELVWWGKIVRVEPENGSKQPFPVFLRQQKQMNRELAARLGIGQKQDPDQWNILYKFQLEPKTFAELHEILDITIARDASHVMNRSLRIIQWKRNRAVIVVSNRLVLEKENGDFESIRLETDEDLVDTILREFPAFTRDFVELAVKRWRELSPAKNI